MPLPWASPAKTLFQASKPAPVLPQGAASTEPAISPRTAANNAAQPKCLSTMRSSAFPLGPLRPARLLEIVNLNHFRKNVPTLIPNGRRVGNGDGFPSHHRPAGNFSEEAPTPPYGASSFLVPFSLGFSGPAWASTPRRPCRFG